MIGNFFKKLFGKDKAQQSQADIAAQTEMLKRGDPADLQKLAASKATSPVILYYLAKNDDPDIRRAVIANPATPVQATTLLASDPNTDVRMALAARIMELMPGLSSDRQSQLYNYAVQALVMLAQDEVFVIRKALSTALRDDAKAPPAVVSRLARDVEREISEPILRFCVALSDDDLLDILSNHPEPWVISSIASRPTVSQEVSTAVVETNDTDAITALVTNSGATFAVPTLQKIIDRAREFPAWHRPIALRHELSVELARQLTGFVDHAVLKVLEQRSDFDAATRANISSIVQRRLRYKREETPGETAMQRLERYVEQGELKPEVIHDALAWHDREFIILALAYLSKISPNIVTKIFNAHSSKTIVAVCWKAKLPMRLAVEVQRIIGKVPPNDMIYAKGGTDYPMKEDDMMWQLELFGVRF